ncbi:hypothetical protein BaRGS_00033353 [Batillaria attramentaria]|uniref:Uncharacterized protein n=1 Tax=Batillaria attramentaria TaxID=370345 RepID=A0ABD0JK75_9CAEN
MPSYDSAYRGLTPVTWPIGRGLVHELTVGLSPRKVPFATTMAGLQEGVSQISLAVVNSVITQLVPLSAWTKGRASCCV